MTARANPDPRMKMMKKVVIFRIHKLGVKIKVSITIPILLIKIIEVSFEFSVLFLPQILICFFLQIFHQVKKAKKKI